MKHPYPTGTAVWTTTRSGAPILCCVLSYLPCEYLLQSPTHGYAIVRMRREVKRVRTAKED